MKNTSKLLQTLNIILGILALIAFVYAWVVLIRLQPKMIAFQELTRLESSLLTGVGFGLLMALAFFLLTLLQVTRTVKRSEELKFFPLLLIFSGVISVLLIFSNFALLGDIHKQYLNELSQPEWSMVFPMLGFQSMVAALYLYLQLSGYFVKKEIKNIVRDVNIFLVVQYVGVICGGMGLAMASLGFFFPTGWSLPVHTILAGLTILFPYALAVLYWVITKIKEKDRIWWDEKQLLDVGKSAMLTLVVNTVLMIGLFIFNIQDLAGVVRMLWLPLYLFAGIFVFSLGNLFFSRQG
jgi:hypothetical protein